MSDYGTFVERGTVRFERLLPGPIERVWEYLTDSKLRATWFAGGTLEQRVGGQVDFTFDHAALTPAGESIPDKYNKDEHYRLRGRVTRCEPPKLIAFTWDASEVTWQLEPRGGDVLLTLTHRNLASRAEEVDVCGGWHSHLDLLGERIRGRVPQRYWKAVEEYERTYEQRIPK